MSKWEDKVNRHSAELVNLTMKAADQGEEPLPEDEVAKLGMLIAVERQLLIDAMSGLLDPLSRSPQNLAFAGPDKKTLYVVGRNAAFKVAMLAQGHRGRAK